MIAMNLLNFWSTTLSIFDCVSNGISDTSSIKRTPPEAFSNAPYVMDPSFFSSPNNSSSYFFASNKAPLIITKGPFFLFEFLYIFLDINSFPDPVGPLIKTLLSDWDNFCIWSVIEIIFELFQIISNEWNNIILRF